MSSAHQLAFVEQLPKRPYCSDDLANGLRIRPVSQALKHRHIQQNPPNHVVSLVFDIDQELGFFAWRDAGLPCPQWITLNRNNGHCHYGYMLKTPVIRTSAARKKPLEWLAMIEGCFKIRLSADKGYSGLITKNPFHLDWDVYWFDYVAPYELAYLDEFCLSTHQDAYYRTLRRKEASGLGRNVQIFDEARQWAYSAVRDYWAPNGFERWQSAVEAHCGGLNSQFTTQLPTSEVRSIAKSISKWVWNRFTPNGFSSVQARRGEKGGKVSRRPTKNGKTKKELLPDIFILKAQGVSNRAIAEKLSISSSTVSLYLTSMIE